MTMPFSVRYEDVNIKIHQRNLRTTFDQVDEAKKPLCSKMQVSLYTDEICVQNRSTKVLWVLVVILIVLSQSFYICRLLNLILSN